MSSPKCLAVLFMDTEICEFFSRREICNDGVINEDAISITEMIFFFGYS
jgi:hypothetical protein